MFLYTLVKLNGRPDQVMVWRIIIYVYNSMSMNMSTVLLFPNTLFESPSIIDKSSTVYLLEHPVHFSLVPYHKMKLVLHRASMKYYESYLKNKVGCKVHYIQYDNVQKTLTSLLSKQPKRTNTELEYIHMYDPTDYDITRNITSLSNKFGVHVKVHESPMFLLSMDDMETYLEKYTPYKKKTYQYSHKTFYKWVRNHLNLLLTNSGKPVGGKWSFDSENRDPFPKDYEETWKPEPVCTPNVKEAIAYVEKHFHDNPGTTDGFYLPIGFKQAKQQVRSFLKERLSCFGSYQDAVKKGVIVGCHSILSPYLNIGFLTPMYVLDQTLTYYNSNKKSIPLSSVEGYIRQLVGWREYTRMLYVYEHHTFTEENYLSHEKQLSSYWYHGDSGTDPSSPDIAYSIPVLRDMVQKVISYGYLHHIERLMYAGNWMLLTQTKPSDAYKWFLSMFVDAYPWVMCSNVYGMSQFSSGTIMMNRPYFSSSNYIHSMSDYKKSKSKSDPIPIHASGTDSGKRGHTDDVYWYDVWDAVYYSFLDKHKKLFGKNYAISRQLKHWTSKSASEKKHILSLAEIVL